MTRVALLLSLTLTCGLLMADEPFQKLNITYSGGPYENETFAYRLMVPRSIEAEKKYPLVLSLHGAGERGVDNELQLKYFPEQMARDKNREQFPCFVLAPQCRPEKKWVDIDWSDANSTPLPEQPSHQLQAAIAMLQRTIKEHPVDESRIYVTGLSMGGYGSWDLLSRHPEWFAAAIIVCGGGDEDQASRLKQIPIWVFHGDADKAVPVERSRTMVKAVGDAGGKQIRYSELPGVGHNSWIQAYSDEAGAIEWMFHQVRKPVPSPTPGR